LASDPYSDINATTQPGATSTSSDDWGTMATSANQSVSDWSAYEANQKKFGGVFGLFNQRNPNITRPTVDEAPQADTYAGGASDPQYKTDVSNWYQIQGRQNAQQNAGFNMSDSQSVNQQNLGNASYNDWNTSNQVAGQNTQMGIAVAKDYQTQRDQANQQARGQIDSAFDQLPGQIQNAKQTAQTNLQNAVDPAVTQLKSVADQGYQDVMSKFDQINSRLNTDESSALGQFRNDTAAQVEQVSGAIRDSARGQAQQAVSQLKQMGYDLNSPQAASALRQVASSSREQIGQVATKAYSDYNATKLSTSTAFANTRASLGASGMSAIGSAGAARDTAYGQAASTILGAQQISAGLDQWAASENSTNAYNKGLLNSYVNQAELSGDTATAQMLQDYGKTQYTPEMPFLQQLYDDKYRTDQTNLSNSLSMIQTIMSAGQLYSIMTGTGAYKPVQPKDTTSEAGMWNILGIGTAGALS